MTYSLLWKSISFPVTCLLHVLNNHRRRCEIGRVGLQLFLALLMAAPLPMLMPGGLPEAMAVPTTYSDGNQSDEPSICPPSPEVAAISQGVPPSTLSANPIHFYRGSAVEQTVDLRLPGPTIDWTFRRSYDSGLFEGDGSTLYDSMSGERWQNGDKNIHLEEFDVVGNSNKDIIMYYTASSSRVFEGDGSGGYTVPKGWRAKLEFDEDIVDTNDYDKDTDTSEQLDVYTLTQTDTGEVFVCLGFHNDTADGYAGKLVERTTREYQSENLTGVRYTYTSDGFVDSLTTAHPQSWSIEYSYDGVTKLLTDVEVFNDDPTPKVIQKVELTYFDTGTHDADVGSDGDLVQVEVSRRASNLSDWITRTTQYRYYSDHKLKMVFESDAINRLIAEHSDIAIPDDILGFADDHESPGQEEGQFSRPLDDFDSRTFTYYGSDLDTSVAISTPLGSDDLEEDYGGGSAAFDEDGMVKTETINGSCASCGGGSGSTLVKTYYYLELAGHSDRNEVKRIVIEDTDVDTTNNNGNEVHRCVYGLNSDGVALRKALIADPDNVSLGIWCHSTTLDDDGRVAERREPSAHDNDVASIDNVETFLDPYDATGNSWSNDSDTLDASGLIYAYSYVDSGDRTYDTVAKDGEGDSGGHIQAVEYGDGADDFLPISIMTFFDKQSARTGSTQKETTISYSFWDVAVETQVKTKTTTLPIVTTGKNGSGEATTTEEYYDQRGRLRWTKDGDGYINYYSYHPDTGALAYQAVDVNPGSMPSEAQNGDNSGPSGEDLKWEDWTVGAASTNKPSARGIGSETLPTALEIVTKKEYDDLGRLVKEIDPPTAENTSGAEHHIVYVEDDNSTSSQTDDDTTLVIRFPYWDGTKSLVPIQVAVRDSGDQLLESFSIKGDSSSVTKSGSIPTGIGSPSQDDYVAWTRYTYQDTTALLTQIDRYHDIPSSGTGTISDDFYRTVYKYDARGRKEYVIQQVSGSPASSGVEQVTKHTFDVLDRVTKVEKGVSSSSHSIGSTYSTYPTLATISETEYDSDGVGNGYVTKSKQYYAAGKYSGAQYHRTFRGHLRGTEPIYDSGSGESDDEGPYPVHDIDWMGRVTATAQYTSAPTWTSLTAYADYIDTNGTNRNYKTVNEHDELGRVYFTKRYPGTQSTDYFEINSYYDRRNNRVASGDTYGAHTEMAYDGAGRMYQQRTVKDVSSSTPYDTSDGEFIYNAPLPRPTFSAMSGGNEDVIQLSHSEMDKAGNVTAQHVVELDHDDTNGFSLTSGEPTDGVRYSTLVFFDKADRVVTSANYGCGTHNVALSFWEAAALPSPTSAPTASSANVLVTEFEYDDASRTELVRDPKDIETKTFYDDLGRRLFVAENFDDFTAGTSPSGFGDGTDSSKDRVTGFEYNGLGSVTKLTAYNGSDTNKQETEYQYEDARFADLPTLTKYPDGDTSSDNVQMTYNYDRTVATRKDQRGVVLTYSYDPLRRLELEGATTISTAEGTIKGIKRTYDDLGRLEKITSTANADGTGTIRNEIVYNYDTYGKLDTSWQSHEGAAATTPTESPHVHYAYDSSATSNVLDDGLRQSSCTYPDGTIIHYTFGTSDSIADRLSRVDKIEENSGGSPGDDITSYAYNGVGRTVKWAVNISGSSTANWRQRHADRDDDDTYEEWDRFGRVVDIGWSDDNVSPTYNDHYTYTYDYASNRTSRNNRMRDSSGDDFDQDYDYDDLHRLTDVDEGDGNETTGVVSSIELEQRWTLDQLGNWDEFKQDTDGNGNFSGSADIDQDRESNEANEIDNDDDHTNGSTNAFTDSTGTGDWFDPVYDAAGNLTTMPQPDDLDDDFTAEYDAWNRLVEVSDGMTVIQTNEYDGLHRRISREQSGTTRHYYYNENWQCVESRNGTSTTARNKNVYHPQYVDALAATYFTGGTNRYFGHDANFNLTVLWTSAGVKERYRYTPYGEVTIMNSSWAKRSGNNSGFANEFLYTGRRLDPVTGLYQYRYRYYHAKLGRFITRDPIGYRDGHNWYAYCRVNPITRVDGFGLKCICVAVPPVAPEKHPKGIRWRVRCSGKRAGRVITTWSWGPCAFPGGTAGTEHGTVWDAFAGTYERMCPGGGAAWCAKLLCQRSVDWECSMKFATTMGPLWIPIDSQESGCKPSRGLPWMTLPFDKKK